MKLTSISLIAMVLLGISACGGGGNSGSRGGGTIQAGASGPVTVVADSTTASVDITVPPAPSPSLNALVLGAADVNATGGSASNTGATVPRGNQARILIFGPGLSANLQISISGPSDINISEIESITSTKGTPGVEFLITVPASSAPGARTVFLKDTKGNITSFTGGLEIQ